MKQETDNALFEKLLGNAESIDFLKLIKVFLSRWWWIVTSVVLAGIVCFLYLKIVTPLYIGSVTLKYTSKQSELDGLTGGNSPLMLGTGNIDYLTEKFNVRSPEVVKNALVKLNNPFSFYRLKAFRRVDVYPFQPIELEVLDFDADTYQYGIFTLDEELQLRYQVGANERLIPLKKRSVVTLPGLIFRVKEIHTAPGYLYEFSYNDPQRLTNQFVGRIDMEETEDAMPVMNLLFRHHNVDFTKDFLEKLVESYEENDLRQKQQSSDLTIHFIKDQVNIYSASLKEAARELELFKQKNQLLDVSSSALEITGKVRELEQRKNELEIQKAYISMLESNMGKTFETVDYLSVGLDGSTDAVLLSLLEGFNSLITQRKGLLQKYSPKSATVQNIDEQLNKFRSQILDNVALQKQKNNRTLSILSENIAILKRQFGQIPALEKNFIYLQSNFEVNKGIYSMLVNKEIESSIVRAGMLPSFRVITQFDTDKVSPKPTRIILIFLMGGLMLGLGLVWMARMLNSTFTDPSRIEQHPRVQLLGIVHHFPEKTSISPQDVTRFLHDRTVFTESLTALRTRISFSKTSLIKDNKPGQGKLLLITSEQAGEGKSFITVNLALSFSKIGKKVLIIGADLRKSRIHLYFRPEHPYGLSQYLEEPGDIKRLIYSSTQKNLDYIPAGPAPFNPAELMQNAVFEDILSYCRETYDYILLDTAPVGLVSDNIPLLRHADYVLFIVRWLYSNPDSFRLAGQLADEYALSEVSVIVNDFAPDNLYSSLITGSYYGSTYSHYQYNYGYNASGYLGNAQSRWKKMLGKIVNFKKK
ncbi:GumC family protein [Arundinibacter roseus]|uniref:non-specific protein-tyrosine kinase n=1 Tax=Arundinibacter roseus TaxID=2070510 RepID=A0A4R4K7H9_9BACT|nr:polysaccharide biosynthesis tyrosine autokinase [Arundinibacter roseus]TDB63460.1 polysaccharide biosynthesis tyrosine autokinase [Arundinibacter roseus]